MKTRRRIIIVSSIIILIMFVFLMRNKYYRDYRLNEVVNITSNDNQYQLLIYQVGEAEFPFGDVDCRIVLKNNNKKITKVDLSLANDGKNLAKNNFLIEWLNDEVMITVDVEEEDRFTCHFHYDGTVD